MGSQLTLLQNTDVDLSHNNVDAGHRDPSPVHQEIQILPKTISVTLAGPIFPSLNFSLPYLFVLLRV